jgi:dihydrolipoamide dehydrogenase
MPRTVIAAGSQPVNIPNIPGDDPRIMDTTGALALADIPHELLVIGGGILGIALTIHPHPTLSETVTMAAQAFEGTITDPFLPCRAEAR